MKELLGTLYFTPVKGEDGKLMSRYDGVVVGFTIRRDDGVEFEVRADAQPLVAGGQLLKWEDLPLLKIGQEVTYIKDLSVKYKIMRVYPTFGDVWIVAADGTKHAVKWTEIRRIV